jgi:ribosomal protein S27AE
VTDSSFTDGIRPHWYPRVPPHLIRQLYENDARGLLDEELIHEVGVALLLRCRSILTATEAHQGRVSCPRCGTFIVHHWDKEAPMICPQCAWQTTWGAYFKTIQHKQLHAGGAGFAFVAYMENYPRAQTPRERMLMIDQLLHAYHHQLTGLDTRPAACNLIVGKIAEVVELLDTLTYGEHSPAEARQQYEQWTEKTQTTDWMRQMLTASRQRRSSAREGD